MEKTITLTFVKGFIQTFVSKVMSLLFNMLSRTVIAFLPRRKHLLILCSKIIHNYFRVQENKICHCFHFYPMYLPRSDGTKYHDLSFSEFWVLNKLFPSPLSPSSKGSLVPLLFLPLGWCHLHTCNCCSFSWQSWFQLELHPAQHFSWCTLHTS